MTTTIDAALDRSRALATAIEAQPNQHRMLTGDRPVVLDQRLGLLVVHAEPLADGVRLIVVALDQRLAGRVVATCHLGRVELDVVRAARGGMRTAAAHALHDVAVGGMTTLSSIHATRAAELAATTGATVIDNLYTPPAVQVMLQVRFAEVNRRALANDFEALVVVIPPKALGEFRKKLHKEAERRIVLTVNKSMTDRPIPDIEELLVGEGAPPA